MCEVQVPLVIEQESNHCFLRWLGGIKQMTKMKYNDHSLAVSLHSKNKNCPGDLAGQFEHALICFFRRLFSRILRKESSSKRLPHERIPILRMANR